MNWLEENANCARAHAAFRLAGDTLKPDSATQALGLHPTLARAKGQEIPADRVGRARRQRTGVWLVSTENVVASTSLERHLVHLLDRLEPVAPALQALRSSQDVRAGFFCYWVSVTGNGGPELSADTLGRIAALDASLGIDFYDDGDERHSARSQLG